MVNLPIEVRPKLKIKYNRKVNLLRGCGEKEK